MSQDDQRWMLWNATTGQAIASGASEGATPTVLDLAGETALTPTEGAIEVRSATDGRVRARIGIPPQRPGIRGLALDGSYVYVGDVRSLRAYDLNGRLLFERPGDYRIAFVYATPTALHVAIEATVTVETVTLAGVGTFSPPYEGRFHSWFLDGSHFVTTEWSTVRVYTADGKPVSLIAHPDPRVFVPNVGQSIVGFGEHLWYGAVNPQRVFSFRIGDAALLETAERYIASGTRRDLPMFGTTRAPREQRLMLHDRDSVDGGAPGTIELPGTDGEWLQVTNDAQGRWAAGGRRGQVVTSTSDSAAPPRPLSCGRPSSLAGARDRLAVATADSKVRVFDLAGGKRKLLRTLDVAPDLSGAKVGFAGDGRYLIVRAPTSEAAGVPSRLAIQIFDLTPDEQSGGMRPPVTLDYPNLAEFTATPHGEHVAVASCESSRRRMCVVHVSKVDGSEHWQTPSFEVSTYRPLFSLSPDGRLAAITRAVSPIDSPIMETGTSETVIYDAQQTQRARVPGVAVATWLDPQRLLVRARTNVRIVDTQGQTLATPVGNVAVGTGEFASDDPDFFHGFGYVYRTSDASIAWSGSRFFELPGNQSRSTEMLDHYTGQAVLGDQVVLGVNGLVHLQRWR